MYWFWYQYHRMVEVGRDLCRLPRPDALLKQGHLDQAAKNKVHMGFWTCPRRETPKPPGAICASGQPPWPQLLFPQWKVFPDVQVELPVFQSIASGLVREPVSIFLTPSLQALMYIDKITPSFLFLRLKSHSFSQPFFISQVLQFLHDFCSPFSLLSPVYLSMLLLDWWAQNWTYVWPQQRWVEDKMHRQCYINIFLTNQWVGI